MTTPGPRYSIEGAGVRDSRMENEMFKTNNYGLTHGLMAAGAMGFAAVVIGGAGLPSLLMFLVAAAVTGYFAWRELQGPGNLFGYPENYTGVYSDLDRILDWAVPGVVSFGLAVAGFFLL